ncbi:MAG: hypothetical protein ACK5B6_04895 [Bacteroidia bacterium]
MRILQFCISLATFLLFCQGVAKAGGEFLTVGARSAGLAHASVTLGDVWSVFHNPAGIASLQRISAGVYYENRFGLPETGLRAGAVALPFGKNAFGLKTCAPKTRFFPNAYVAPTVTVTSDFCP